MNKHRESAVSVNLPQKSKVKRILGLWDLFAIGYGDLGSSIYYALGITAIFAMGATPLALAIAGVVFICTALSYAELGSVYPESGGSASFARHAFNDLISFVAGWGLLLDYIVTIAISAFAIAPYLAVFHPIFVQKGYHVVFTTIIVAVLYTINLFGVRHSTRTNLFIATIAILTQVLIIVLGVIFVLNIPLVIDHLRIGVPGASWSPSWSDFLRGIAMAMVAYTGIESIAQLGAESVKASKNLPRAIVLNIVALLSIYMGISIVGLSALTPLELGTTYVNDPLAGIVQAFPFAKSWLPSWIGIIAAILLFAASNAGLVGSSRLAYNMGEYYQLPRFFSRLHPKFRTPHIALIVFAALAIFIIALSRGQLSFLADLYNFGAMIAFFSTNLSLIVLRIKKPDLSRPFKIGLNIPIGRHRIPITAVIGCLATFSVWVLVVITKPDGRYLGLTWMIIGIWMFLHYRKKRGLTTKGVLTVHKVKIPHFEPLELDRIIVSIQSAKDNETVQMACEIAKLHKAKLAIVHVLDIPNALPLDAKLMTRVDLAETLLKHAEALARQEDITVDTHIVRGRTFNETLLTFVGEQKFDLLVVGWSPKVKEKLMGKCSCRIWLCAN